MCYKSPDPAIAEHFKGRLLSNADEIFGVYLLCLTIGAALLIAFCNRDVKEPCDLHQFSFFSFFLPFFSNTFLEQNRHIVKESKHDRKIKEKMFPIRQVRTVP